MDQRFLDVNRRLNLMDPSIQVVGKPVERRGQWLVVYMQEKSGQTRCKKKRVPKLSQEQFATFDEANSIQSKLAVAERLLAELSATSESIKRKIEIGTNILIVPFCTLRSTSTLVNVGRHAYSKRVFRQEPLWSSNTAG